MTKVEWETLTYSKRKAAVRIETENISSLSELYEMSSIKQLLGFFKGVSFCYGDTCDVTPFAIVFLPRTGSNLLASMLDTHPEVMCHQEIFNPQSPHRCQSARDGIVDISLGSAAERNADPWGFLQMVFCRKGQLSNGQDNPVKSIGAKVAHYDGVLIFLSILLNRHIKKLVLIRKNTLATYVSNVTAERSGIWGSLKNSKKRNEIQKVEIDFSDYKKFHRRRSFYYRILSIIEFISGQKFFYLEYKEIKDKNRIAEILEYIGVANEPVLKEKFRKQGAAALAERIKNIDELRKQLVNTKYYEYLDD